ncbi:MAG: ABC transporter permease, partial [Chloroflexi bacterium]|nr:ABC transporter permease [Chloroflexota bacterium]
FEVGTYADYEAWIALADAQTLLGWGGDVSVFIVPVDGPLKAGDVLSEGISVVRRGESGMDLVQEWAPFFRLLHQINLSLGAAIAISLMHNMWRISWQRRRDLAILTSMGFNRSEIYLYLISYGIGIAIVGIALAGLASIVVFNLIQLRTAGITTEAIHEPEEILIGLVVVLISTLLAAGIPARNLLKRNVIELMKIES